MIEKDFDYTPRMIAAQRGFSYLRDPNPITNGLRKVKLIPSLLEDPEMQWRSEWPTMGDEKYCSECVHWVKEFKTHGQAYCELTGESDYCRSHGKCYWRHKRSAPKPKPFLTEEDFKL